MRLFLISLFFLGRLLYSHAQVTVTVQINSGSSFSTCGDPFGTPDLHWQVNIAGQGYQVYPQSGICFNNTPNIQYSESFSCSSAIPSFLTICFQAFENDGSPCVAGTSCLETRCQNFAVPAPGSSYTSAISIPNDGINDSWGNVNFTISSTGSFPPGAGYDVICDAVNLGALNTGATLGDNTLSNYANFCANAAGDPSPWGAQNDQGVWFRFTTGTSPGSIITIDATSDSANAGSDIDLQLALYESSNNACTGALTLVESDYDGAGVIYNEEMAVSCLSPNTNYFLLVDGEGSGFAPDAVEGYFGLEIIDNGIEQGGDEICEANDLGTVPNGGSVGTTVLSQSNACATNTNDPTSPSFTSNQGVWYSFVTPLSGSVNIDANSDLPFPAGVDAIDIQLSLYSSSNGLCSGTLTHVQSSYIAGINDEDLNATCLSPGTRYWLMVDGSTLNSSGTFDVTISDANFTAASNDLICSATSLGNPWSAAANLTGESNYCAGSSGEPVPAAFPVDQSVWYSFNTPASGGPFAIDVSALPNGGDVMDLQLAVYSSSDNTCSGGLTELASNYGFGTFDESLNVQCLLDGSTYFLMVDGSNLNVEGMFDLTLSSAALSGINCFLPVELISFTGIVEGSSSLLEWQTLSESNNDYFTLERSSDGLAFERLETIAGQGNSVALTDYTFRDVSPERGINYYRLSQTDFDGSTKVVGNVAINHANYYSELRVVPNPIKNNSYVQFNSAFSGEGTLEISTPGGLFVSRNRHSLAVGKNMIPLESAELAPGLYIVRLYFGDEHFTARFLK